MKISRQMFLLALLASFVLFANFMHATAATDTTSTDTTTTDQSAQPSGRRGGSRGGYKRQARRMNRGFDDSISSTQQSPYERSFRGIRYGRWGVAGPGAMQALLNQNFTMAQIKDGISRWLDETKSQGDTLGQVLAVLEAAGDKALEAADQDKVVDLLTQVMNAKVTVLKAGTHVRGALPVFGYIFSKKLLAQDKQAKLQAAIENWNQARMQSAARDFLGNMSLDDIQKKLQGRDGVENLVTIATLIKNAQGKTLSDPDQLQLMTLIDKEKMREEANSSRSENMMFQALLINLSNNNLVSVENKTKIDQYIDDLIQKFGKSSRLFAGRPGFRGRPGQVSQAVATTPVATTATTATVVTPAAATPVVTTIAALAGTDLTMAPAPAPAVTAPVAVAAQTTATTTSVATTTEMPASTATTQQEVVKGKKVTKRQVRKQKRQAARKQAKKQTGYKRHNRKNVKKQVTTTTDQTTNQ
ncbi:hypothetical protein K2X40_00375 [Candidatus Babeliales bacterium]|nr:hypothetical protein [Candidatus Babeliales bacterium]